MSESKHGSASGKARALLQKEEAKQRIDEYNQNPNLCLCCNKPILAPYDKKLHKTKIKKFCSRSCAAKFNNCNSKKVKNVSGFNGTIPLICTKTDEEIIEAFNNSNSIAEFGRILGYKYKLRKSYTVCNKLESLGLDINDIDGTPSRQILNLKKGELFSKYDNWQTARSSIQKYARIIYQNSNKPKQCICCNYDKHYEVAHIKAVSDFNDDALISEINDIDNLIALCPNHHCKDDNTNIHTHIKNLNPSYKLIDNVVNHKIPTRCGLYYLESHIRLTDNEDYKRKLQEYYIFQDINNCILEDEIIKKSISNLTKEVCEFYKYNYKSYNNIELAQKFNIHVDTVRKYLKIGEKYGWCRYIGMYEKIQENKQKVIDFKISNPTMSALKMSKILNISDDTIRKYLKEQGENYGTELCI